MLDDNNIVDTIPLLDQSLAVKMPHKKKSGWKHDNSTHAKFIVTTIDSTKNIRK